MSNYFRKLPEFEYVSRFSDRTNLDFVRSKNLFRKPRLRDDINENMWVFDKYIIKGDMRPDNVAEELYRDPTYDWVILVANNITNIWDQWPLAQRPFESFLIDKYGSIENANKVRHYVTTQIKDGIGRTVLPAGKIVDSDYSLTYYDAGRGEETIATSITAEVTFKSWEEDKNNEKREIKIINPLYIPTIEDDIDRIMQYGLGTQYINKKLKRADNIRLTS